jgi:hypothetical protein
MNDTMTFTVTAYGKTVTITQPEDLNIHEFLDTCRQLAMVMEYHEESWEDAIIAAADAIEANDVLPTESGNLAYNPLASKREMWLHNDGQMRDYPDIDNITLPSDC